MNLESKLIDVRRQVRQQLLALAEARQRIALRREQITQARGKLALAEVKFGHEMADNFDVIEAETEVERARGSLLATEAEYAVGVYNLQAMTGHLFDLQPFVLRARKQ
jgi:outer membrane protein TolC